GPPNTRRPLGRPDKKRNRTEDIGIRSKRHAADARNSCGHNAATCKEPLGEGGE
ncbi:hypothetical protein V1509DRAFT_562256, partial [Lipomyces kononenkoae]